MNETKNQKKWMSNLRRQLEKELGSQEEWNIVGVDVYICHPPLIIRLENTARERIFPSAFPLGANVNSLLYSESRFPDERDPFFCEDLF